MPSNLKMRLLGIVALLVVLVSCIRLYWVVSPYVNAANRLASSSPVSTMGFFSTPTSEASITGGRARGGSFDRPSGSTAPSLPSPREYRRDPDYDYPRSYYPQPAPPPIFVPVPQPTYIPDVDYAPTGGGFDITVILVLLVLGFAVLPIVFNYLRLGSFSNDTAGSTNELLNDTVTVSELQIALLAQARELQPYLDNLTAQADLSTQAGLSEMLRETVLALLRTPESWTHVRASSRTVKSRAAASQLFEQLSIEERSKFSTETLVNVGGQVRRQTATYNADENDPAAYIVVTLLLGTANDQPLIGQIYSIADLQTALQKLGALPPDYVLVYELLWTPQAAGDTLSRDELLAQYPNLVQL